MCAKSDLKMATMLEPDNRMWAGLLDEVVASLPVTDALASSWVEVTLSNRIAPIHPAQCAPRRPPVSVCPSFCILCYLSPLLTLLCPCPRSSRCGVGAREVGGWANLCMSCIAQVTEQKLMQLQLDDTSFWTVGCVRSVPPGCFVMLGPCARRSRNAQLDGRGLLYMIALHSWGVALGAAGQF